MINLTPPIAGFTPFTIEATTRIRLERERRIAEAFAEKEKKPRKKSATSPKAKKATNLPIPDNLPPETRAMVLEALRKQGLL